MSAAPPFGHLTRLSLTDIARMAALHAQAFPASEAWSERQFEDLLAQDSMRAYAIDDRGSLLVFGVIQIVLDQAEILTLATASKHRRRGVATRLLTEVEGEFIGLGFKKWLLDVAADNPGALAFYQKTGFEIDGRRPGYYKRLEGKRVDAILMSKPMAGQAAA